MALGRRSYWGTTPTPWGTTPPPPTPSGLSCKLGSWRTRSAGNSTYWPLRMRSTNSSHKKPSCCTADCWEPRCSASHFFCSSHGSVFMPTEAPLLTELIQHVRGSMRQLTHSGVQVSSGISALGYKLGPVGCGLVGFGRLVNELSKGEAGGLL
jgi:hypothetical protein